MARDKLLVFSGNSNPGLAEEIVKYLDISLGRAVLGVFSDGEIKFQSKENVRGADIFIIQSLSRDINFHIMQLLLMADAFSWPNTMPEPWQRSISKSAWSENATRSASAPSEWRSIPWHGDSSLPIQSRMISRSSPSHPGPLPTIIHQVFHNASLYPVSRSTWR